MTRLAELGLPVAAPLGAPKRVDGALHILMPFLAGRALGVGAVDEGRYRELGRRLADYHAIVAKLPLPPQRPGWCETVDSALPMTRPGSCGGASCWMRSRASIPTWHAVSPLPPARWRPAICPRLLPARRELVVQSDFAPWNIRLHSGRMVGLLDFELAHVDVSGADVAYARRGYHDAVVDGYLERATLTDAELASLDGLWLGGILAGNWRVLEGRIAEGSDLAYGMDWDLAQLDKTRPYRG